MTFAELRDAEPLKAEVRRGKIMESVHYAYAVCVDSHGKVMEHAGIPGFVTTMRSSGKPLQAIPAITHPDFAGLQVSDEEVAIMCASHDGEPRQSALAASVLALSGFIPDDLICGPEGKPPSPLRHGCSGNHSAILLAAKLMGAPLFGYEQADHPAEEAILKTIMEMSGVENISVATDGCGVPTFGLPLTGMATAFARLVQPGADWARIPVAMTRYPELVGVDSRIDVRIMRATGGRILAKTGAEGLLCLAHRTQQLGAAIKVIDGSHRALGPLVLHWLRRIGWLTESEFNSTELDNLREPQLKTPDGRVGAVICDAS